MLPVRLTPKAQRDEVRGAALFDGEVVIAARVRALPEAGRANQALEKLIAGWLGVPASSVTVAQGGKSRLKQVKVEGDADRLTQLIAARIGKIPPPTSG
jgi:uncharacterized protein YggU (UPF0235/DUF167 family)